MSLVDELEKAPVVEVKGDWEEEIERAVRRGYEVGFAQGELSGRLALAMELEARFDEHPEEWCEEEAMVARLRQVH